MKHLIDRVPGFLKNFYVLSSAFFIVWLMFFDSNDIITQVQLTSKEAELEKAKEFYLTKVEEVKADREALLSNDDLLEKLAREKYLMKKKGEDIFVVVEEE